MSTSFFSCRLSSKMLGCFETESSFFVEIAHRLSFFACVRLCGNLAIAVFSDKLISITQNKLRKRTIFCCPSSLQRLQRSE